MTILVFSVSAKKHDEVKEWVLAISMDQKVEQQLPIDSRLVVAAATHRLRVSSSSYLWTPG